MTSQAVSVVIPTYRRGEVLIDTIRYLLRLPMQPLEILVVDQTEEHPPRILSSFQKLEKGIVRRIVLRQPSITNAMNVGLQKATGEIVLFLDDDIIPDESLVSAHQMAHEQFPEAWTVVGQVLQPENGFQVLEGGTRFVLRSLVSEGRRSGGNLRRDLDFQFNSNEPAWIENVMAGNLSVKKKFALHTGGFDENFIPPVSYRFETEFARRIIKKGGKIKFEPKASIRHLRISTGGTRSKGSHLNSISPIHGVGDYYYALCCGAGLEKLFYILKRPFREVHTKFHLKHPWWIPVKFIGEIRSILLAIKLFKRGPKYIDPSHGR